MKIFKKWSNWIDIEVRESSGGYHYLLQMREREDGKKQFKNINIDGIFTLFHGEQGIHKIVLTSARKLDI